VAVRASYYSIVRPQHRVSTSSNHAVGRSARRGTPQRKGAGFYGPDVGSTKFGSTILSEATGMAVDNRFLRSTADFTLTAFFFSSNITVPPHAD
jgi:hypothetical protein